MKEEDEEGEMNLCQDWVGDNVDHMYHRGLTKTRHTIA